jgi:hypothetical protein
MKGSWALVTGASSGLGWAIAEQFAAQGVNLIITARREDRLIKLKDQIVAQHKVQVEPLLFDVRNLKECEAALKQKSSLVANVSILVNNAGLAKGTDPVAVANTADWDQMIDTNIKGLLYITRLVLPYMLERNSGHIVNLGSVGGRWVAAGGAVYCATKFAVRAISEGLRADLHGKPIRVTNIEPGAVETEFTLVRTGSADKSKAFYSGYTPLTAKDIADAVVWCVQRPAHMNVQEMVIFPVAQVGVGPTSIQRT